MVKKCIELPHKNVFISLLVFGNLYQWHWEAMLITYLSTKSIVLPFDNLKELVGQTSFKIILIPGSAFEDAFKLSKDLDWKLAWTQRVQPYLEENKKYPNRDALVQLTSQDSKTALYDFYISIR